MPASASRPFLDRLAADPAYADSLLAEAGRIARLRVFGDDAGKMNRSVQDIGGGVLSVSQFTLYGDVRKGRRPSWTRAAKGNQAEPLYERFMAELEAADPSRSDPAARA